MNGNEVTREAVIAAISTHKIHPHIPDLMEDIINITKAPSSSVSDMVRIIEKHAELSDWVLKISNSGFYSFKRNVKTVQEAVVALGWNAMKMICLGSTILKRMSEKDSRLYRHSVLTARIAKFLAGEADFYRVEEISIVGLLHDFGITILEEYFNKNFLKAKQYALDNGLPMHIAEREILGVDHADVGGWTLQMWKLPENITESVALHHSFDPQTFHARKTAIIHLADVLALAVDFNGPGWEKVYELSPAVFETLGFSTDNLKDFILSIMKMKNEPMSL